MQIKNIKERVNMKDDNISQYRNVSTWTNGVYIKNLRKLGWKGLTLHFSFMKWQLT